MSGADAAGRTHRYIVGITGASGAVFGVRLLERMREFDVETHLTVSPWGARTLEHETGYSVADLKRFADVVHRPNDQGATISSGSFRTSGMIIAPCSVKTLASIATGSSEDLVGRAADVVLKERGRLALVVRESPLSEIHLENMLKLTRMGAAIIPPVPAFYTNPETLGEMIDHIVTRVLDQVGLVSESTSRWNGNVGGRARNSPRHK